MFLLGPGLKKAVRSAVRLKGTGRFFCLHCEAVRGYERREWRGSVFSAPESRRREFILCCTCETAFSPECLDESSDSYLEELSVAVPDRAIYPRLRDVPWRSSGHGEEIVGNPRPNVLIAYSAGRRH
jgi:hypothetical protein